MKISWILCFLTTVTLCESCRVLVTVMGVSGSQNLIMYRLADMLAERGNEVTILKWDVFPEAKQIKLKKTRVLTYPLVEGPILDEMREKMSDFAWKKQTLDFGFVKELFTQFTNGCGKFLRDKNHPVHKEFMSTKYDVIVIHTFDLCSFGLAKVVENPSIIWMSTAFMLDPMAEYSGVPAPPSFIPSAIVAFTDQMTLPQRLINFGVNKLINLFFRYFLMPIFTQTFRDHYGSDFPAISDLVTNTQLYFINADPFFEYARPTQHNIIYMGGMTMQKPEPMSAEWQKKLEEAPGEGIVVFSLGSVAKTESMPMKMKETFAKAFAKFPQFTFFYRIDGDVPDDLAPNVQIIGWMPQKELLGHDKVKAFITHGGYNSLTESTYLGMPLIMMPLFGDQYANAKRMERLKLGVSLDKNDLKQEHVIDALETVLMNKGYLERAKRLSRMIQLKPVQSAELAMKWIEFLAQFRTVDNLLPQSRHMNFIEYYSVDVISILCIFASLIIYLFYRFIKCCCRFCCKHSEQKTKRE